VGRGVRGRAVPGWTKGGPMAGTHTPWSRSAADAVTARSFDPRMMGMMGLGWPGATRPMLLVSLARNRSPSGLESRRTAARAAALSGGVGAVLKM
jgi:hypothetical protein